MGYVGTTVEIPAGKGGLNTDNSPLEIPATDLILAEGVLQGSGGGTQKEGGADLFDVGGLAGAPIAAATLSAANRDWIGLFTSYKGASIAAVGNIGTNSSGLLSPGSHSLTIVVGVGGVGAGHSIIISVGTTGSALPQRTFSCTDTKGNVYVVEYAPSTPNPPNGTAVLACHNCTALVSGDVITVTVGNLQFAESFAIVANEYSGITSTPLDRTSENSGTGADWTVSATALSQLPELLVGHGSVNNNPPPPAAATLSYGRTWNGALTTYKGTAPAFVSLVGTHLSTVVATSYPITVGAGGVGAGHSIIVSVILNSVAANNIVCNDSKGNTYALDLYVSPATTPLLFGAVMAVLSCHNATALVSGDTITVTLQVAKIGSVIVNEFSGLNASGALDRTDAAFSALADPAWVVLGGALSQLPELVVGHGLVVPNGATVAPTVTAINGFTKSGDSCNGAVGDHRAWAEYRVETAVTVAAAGGFTKLGDATTTGDCARVWQQYRIDTTSPNIIALHDWWPTSTVQRLVSAALDGALYKEVSGDLDSVTLKTGLSTTARPGLFVSGGQEVAGNARKLFYLNGVDKVQVLSGDGTSTTDLANPPADWANTGNRPVGATVHANRLIGFGNANFPHVLYFSATSDHENFTGSSLTMTLASKLGDRIYAAVGFNSILYVFKYPRGVLFAYTSDPDITNWTNGLKSEALGIAASPHAVLSIDDDVLFLSSDGSIHKLSAIDNPKEKVTSDLTQALGIRKWFRDHINLSRLHQVISAWYPQKKLAMFALPSTHSLTNDLILYLDFTGDRVKAFASTRDNPEAVAIRRDTDGIERPITGEGGYVYKLDQAQKTKGVVSGDSIALQTYTSRYQTPHIDFSTATASTISSDSSKAAIRAKRKNFDVLELILRPMATEGSLTVETLIDQDETATQTLTFKTNVRRQRRRLVGNGRTFSLRVTSDDDFDVLSHLVGFRISDEDIR